MDLSPGKIEPLAEDRKPSAPHLETAKRARTGNRPLQLHAPAQFRIDTPAANENAIGCVERQVEPQSAAAAGVSPVSVLKLSRLPVHTLACIEMVHVQP